MTLRQQGIIARKIEIVKPEVFKKAADKFFEITNH